MRTRSYTRNRRWATYEETKSFLARRAPDSLQGMPLHFCAGISAGVVNSVVTNPLDTMKVCAQISPRPPYVPLDILWIAGGKRSTFSPVCMQSRLHVEPSLFVCECRRAMLRPRHNVQVRVQTKVGAESSAFSCLSQVCCQTLLREVLLRASVVAILPLSAVRRSLTPSTHHQMLRKEGLSSLGWSSPGSHIFRPCTLHACMFSTCPEPLLSRRVFVFVLVPAARSRRTGLGAQKLQRFPTGPATVAGPVIDGVAGRRAQVCSVCKP